MLLLQTKKELLYELGCSLSLAFTVELNHFHAVLLRFPACEAENLFDFAIQIEKSTQLFDLFFTGLTQKVNLTPHFAFTFGSRNIEGQLWTIFEAEGIIEKFATKRPLNELNQFGFGQTEIGKHGGELVKVGQIEKKILRTSNLTAQQPVHE